jgi:outer membrane protein OmpA-like peptidoglycan-associated protein
MSRFAQPPRGVSALSQGALLVSLGLCAPAAQAQEAQTKEEFIRALTQEAPANPAPVGLFKSLKPNPVTFRCEESAAFKNLIPVAYTENNPRSTNMRLQFELNSARLSGPDQIRLTELALAMSDPQLSQARFAVVGHTDTTGDNGPDRDLNPKLSCARAKSAMDYLVSRGVAASRLTAYGFGSRNLLPGHGPTDAAHRRVEVQREPEPQAPTTSAP